MGERCCSSFGNHNKTQSKQVDLISLPNEILFRIFSFLPKNELFWSIGLTCQKFFVITCNILEHTISLGNEVSYQEQFNVRLMQLQKYKEVRQSIEHFFLGGGESCYLHDNLKKIKNTSTSGQCNDLTVLCNREIIVEEADDIFNCLRKLTNLKGFFIFRDSLCSQDPLQPPSEIPDLCSISQLICEYLSNSNCQTLERLGLIGFTDDRICKTVLNVKRNNLNYIDMSQCRFSRSAISKLVNNCQNLEQVILYNVTDIKDMNEELSNTNATIEYGLVSPYWKNRASILREQFCKYGGCGKSVTSDQIVKGLTLDNIIDSPEPLLALFMAARDWRSIREGSYGVYGCNLFAQNEPEEHPSDVSSSNDDNPITWPIFMDKEMVFGDAFEMIEWSDRHPHPNCGDNGWECFAAVSEFDYLFVCTDINSPDFGGTRCIVNNCDEDNEFTRPPFDTFVKRLESYARAREAFGDDQDAMLENLDFLDVLFYDRDQNAFFAFYDNFQ